MPSRRRSQGRLHRQSSKTTSNPSSPNSRSKGRSAPRPANVCSFPATSSKPTPSPPSPTRSANPGLFRIRPHDPGCRPHQLSLHLHSGVAPAADKDSFKKAIGYSVSSESTPNSFTVRRNYTLGEIIFPAEQYPDLRTFYSKMETKDQETVVLTTAPATATATPPGN